MTKSPTIKSYTPALERYQPEILAALRRTLQQANASAIRPGISDLTSYYGQMHYHLGWVDEHYTEVSSNPGKLLRPTLLLLAYEAAGAWDLQTVPSQIGGQGERLPPSTPPAPQGGASAAPTLQRALPAAAAIELTHNFTLIHDDIEDRDAERRHRRTLWKVWGIPQAINTGDGMFALARLALWGILDEGVDSAIATRLGALLDRACLMISEGQYLDISFETRDDISVAMYVDMISRKTAELIGCAAEMGALLGTRDVETIERLRSFGYAMGIAFQVRDDLLGVWATTAELGKTPAGDIYRRKKSLPVLHALEHANADDHACLRQVYRQETPITAEQVEAVLAIFDRTETKAYCRSFLAEQCRFAYEALANVPRNGNPIAARALHDMEMLVHFVEDAIH